MKALLVYGTRPEAIKIAPLASTLPGLGVEVELVTTGQHGEMLRNVSEVFGLAPKHDLELLSPGQSLSELLSRGIAGLSPILAAARADAVIVQGDTSSALAAALVGFYHRIPVVHLEAGLRSFNLSSPFPEEANRKLVGAIAALHLAPTENSRANLVREGIDPTTIVVTGNTVIDALQFATNQTAVFCDGRVARAVSSARRIILVTMHRRENLGEGMRSVSSALRQLAQRFRDCEIVLPVHRNPMVRTALLPELEGLPNVLICEPLGYGEFAQLLRAAELVLTDSGGVQEEAPALGKPVLVLRENTERPEAVDAGTVKLVGTDTDRIVNETSRLLESKEAYDEMARAINPYGDGRAAKRAAAAIAEMLGVGVRLPDFSPSSPADHQLRGTSQPR